MKIKQNNAELDPQATEEENTLITMWVACMKYLESYIPYDDFRNTPYVVWMQVLDIAKRTIK